MFKSTTESTIFSQNQHKNSLKISNRSPEVVSRRPDNTIAKQKRIKGQIMINDTHDDYDNISFVLDKYTDLDLSSASSQNEQSAEYKCCSSRTYYPDSLTLECLICLRVEYYD
jgi:hypothetical protein